MGFKSTLILVLLNFLMNDIRVIDQWLSKIWCDVILWTMLFASMIGVTINFYTGLDVDFNDIKIDFKYGEIMILITCCTACTVKSYIRENDYHDASKLVSANKYPV
ncbi:hypothetical protein U3516DRAFT_796143 [Neocallimastix sp. 'constans']